MDTPDRPVDGLQAQTNFINEAAQALLQCSQHLMDTARGCGIWVLEGMGGGRKKKEKKKNHGGKY
jgi:predicted aldo/keto reductase-like oxidoreductase